MAVYVDDAIWEWRGKKWAHLVADTTDELHEFARRLGLRQEWFQEPKPGAIGGWPHYDVTEGMRRKAIARGARKVTSRELVYIIRRMRTEQAMKNRGSIMGQVDGIEE